MPLTPATMADFFEAKNDILANSIARSEGRTDLIDYSIPPSMTVGGLLITRSEHRGLRAGWAKIPQELKDKILTFAMIADGGEVRLLCLSPRDSHPNIALSLLRVNRKTHNLAIKVLYEENTVVFTNYGSDLKLLYKTISPNTRLDVGIMKAGGPFFGHVTLELGSKHFSELSWAKVTGFTGALLSLPYGFLTVKNLTIDLLQYSFRNDDELYPFTEALGRIEVTESFVLKGLGHHLELDVRQFATELQTKKQPQTSRFMPQNRTFTSPGWFKDVYEVASPRGSGNADGWILKDATAFYDHWKASLSSPNTFSLTHVETSYHYTAV